MLISRALLAVVGAALILSAGCSSRQDQLLMQELRTENARLTQELNALQQTARDLEIERNYLREENARLRETAVGIESQLRSLSGAGSSLGTGFTANITTGGLSMDQDFFFKLGSADITPEGEAALARLATVLNSSDHRGTTVIIEGHTDNTPVSRRETIEKFGDNWGLSAMRAAAVIRVLAAKGVDVKRIRGAFRGEHSPAAVGSSREDKAKNRRVEIFLTL